MSRMVFTYFCMIHSSKISICRTSMDRTGTKLNNNCSVMNYCEMRGGCKNENNYRETERERDWCMYSLSLCLSVNIVYM